MTASLYRAFDERGDLLYVGITQRGPTRFRQHAKGAPWWDQTVSLTVEHFATVDEARRAESSAILAEQPRFNVQGKTWRAATPTVPTSSATYQLASHYLGEDAGQFVRDQRAKGKALRVIAREVWLRTNGEIDISIPTVSHWIGKSLSPEAVA